LGHLGPQPDNRGDQTLELLDVILWSSSCGGLGYGHRRP
jgi:hypothetical protein